MLKGKFKSPKCKTILRLAMSRIKLLRNKRDVLVKQMRKDIAQLLMNGQDPSARIRVEHIAREQNVMAAYDLMELFCELIIARLCIIESQKACPLDLKEAISTLIFASPRCADLPELVQLRTVFLGKYGKEFVAAAMELRPDCAVNRRVVEKLAVRTPSAETKVKILTEIAAENNVAWDPSATLAELLKKPDDLLEGPKTFIGASEAPIAERRLSFREKCVRERTEIPSPATPSSSDSDEDDEPRTARQFTPFSRPMYSKGPPARPAPAKHESSSRAIGGAPNSDKVRGDVGRAKGNEYEDATAAAEAAARAADRAVAAARVAANLANSHPFRQEHLRRSASATSHAPARPRSEESSLGRSSSGSSGRRKEGLAPPPRCPPQQRQPGMSGSCYVTSDSFYRSSNDGNGGFHS